MTDMAGAQENSSRHITLREFIMREIERSSSRPIHTSREYIQTDMGHKRTLGDRYWDQENTPRHNCHA
jgi:hypothetical protein